MMGWFKKSKARRLPRLVGTAKKFGPAGRSMKRMTRDAEALLATVRKSRNQASALARINAFGAEQHRRGMEDLLVALYRESLVDAVVGADRMSRLSMILDGGVDPVSFVERVSHGKKSAGKARRI